MPENSPVAPTVSVGSASAPSPPVIPSMLVPAGVPLDPLGAPAGEACPPPLVWQEVLATYHTESQPWELARGDRRLTGRTWGQGPPLYLLNSFVGTAELYALLLYLLRDSFRCVVFDTIPLPRSRPALRDYAEDLFAVADLHGDHSLGIFAPSFGAAVAIQAAASQPERVTGLVLQHGFVTRPLSWTERMLARWCRSSKSLLETVGWRRRIQELNHRRWFPPFDETRFQFLIDSTGKIPLADLGQKALALHSVNLQGNLPRITCPVLLIRTEGQGRVETAGHEALEKALPQARTEPLHSTGLHPYLTHPHRLAKLLKPFFLGDQ